MHSEYVREAGAGESPTKRGLVRLAVSQSGSRGVFPPSYALFTSRKILNFATVALSFIFDNF